MSRKLFLLASILAGCVAVASGCRPQAPFHFCEANTDLGRYLDIATEIEQPDLNAPSLDEVLYSKAPLTLENPKPEQIWELTLEEAVKIGLENSKVIRSLGGVVFNAQGPQGVPQALLSSPGQALSVYAPALEETNARTGVEAALAQFDTQFGMTMGWERNDTPQNTAGFLSSFRPEILQQDTATFQSQLQKVLATGATVTERFNVLYNKDNIPVFDPTTFTGSKIWSTDYTTNLEVEMRQPLLAGAGVTFNRIAGPGAIPGFTNGVMIARLRTDQILADFEIAVRNFTSDVEITYWNLYFAYRRLDSVKAGRDSALQTWRQTSAKYTAGSASAQEEAQARQQYFGFRAQVEEALGSLFKTENHLRYMMGVAASDGRLIRPKDDPTTAKVEFDYHDVQAEALVRSAELRRQKWVVKQRELELIAAKNFLLPRLDAVGRYRWLGLGNELIDPNRGLDDTGHLNSSFASMTSGRFQEWRLGVELLVPLGFRKELAGVRFAELNLLREKKVLQEMELELTHQLDDASNDLDMQYGLSQTHYQRRAAAKREVEAAEVQIKVGTATLDLLLNAQQHLADAEVQYYRSLVDYNLAIKQIHLRKGSLLEYNGVFLAEGPWPGKAYFDARRRARARDAGHYFNYGFTEPRVVSRGAMPQQTAAAATVRPTEGPLPPTAPLGGPLSIETLPEEAVEGTPVLLPPAETELMPQASSVPGESSGVRRASFDVGAGLSQLAQAAADGSEAPQADAAVRPAGFQPPAETVAPTAPAAAEAAPSWTPVGKPRVTHETNATPAAAPSAEPASGWKAVQR